MADDFSEGFEAGWGAARSENIYSMEHELAEALAERTTPQPLAIGLDRGVLERLSSAANEYDFNDYDTVEVNAFDLRAMIAACLPAAPTGGRS